LWSLARQSNRLVRWLVVAVALPFATVITLHGSPEGQRVWFRFNKAFISANYTSGEALGTVRAQTWGAAGTVHPTKCGGSDGELHVGAKDEGLSLPASQTPLSAKALGADADWGVVFELPDAKAGNGPSTLKKHVGKTIRFNGYFRVWNEGHWKRAVHPSNPHHVFEVHPSWRFTFQGGSFDEPSLIRAMAGYRGYGLSKYEKVLDEVGDWLKAYQDNDFLFVQLQDASNFFQLPVEITGSASIDGGTELTLDVYCSNQYKRLVYGGLRGVVVDGATLGADLSLGKRLTLLGFFSVNLKTALDAIPATATSPGLAWAVKDALEFFVFGKAKKPAWRKGQTCE
jgi:hypothetical protein